MIVLFLDTDTRRDTRRLSEESGQQLKRLVLARWHRSCIFPSESLPHPRHHRYFSRIAPCCTAAIGTLFPCLTCAHCTASSLELVLRKQPMCCRFGWITSGSISFLGPDSHPPTRPYALPSRLLLFNWWSERDGWARGTAH